MRKKLLALLMCATMVLGTAVTASAATTVKEAQKVYHSEAEGGCNAKNFIDEYYPSDSIIKSTTSNGVRGTVEYGYFDNSEGLAKQYTPTVVFKGSGDVNTVKGTWYAATPVAGKLSVTENGVRPANISVAPYSQTAATAAQERVQDAITNASPVALATALAAQDAAFAVEVKDENGASKQYMLVNVVAGVVQAGVKSEGMVSNTDRWIKVSRGDNLVKGSKNILKSTDENAYGTLYSTLGYVDGLLDSDSVISAIDGGVFSKDAVAVKVTAYLQGTYASESLGLENETPLGAGKAKVLVNVDKLQAGKYTFDSDLITRTAFKDAEAVNVFQPTIAQVKFDQNLGTVVKDFVKVATVAVDKTITFDNNATFVDGVFVFDKGELAAEPEADKNDGVSDTTTTTTTDNTASPKTGDVAPIAALAVVMMGAFGAMVVASKKRA